MPDPFDDLDNLRELDTTWLPAEQVRARGDRRRRRRATLTGTGAVAAIATLALTVNLAGGTDRVAPDPAIASPSPPSATGQAVVPLTIPDDVPLNVGLPAESLDGTPVEVIGSPGVDPLDLCGQTVLAAPGAIDAAGVTYSGGEDYRTRTLLALTSADEAADFVAGTAQTARDCPRARDDVGTLLVEPVGAELGDDAAAFATRYEGNGPLTGLTTYHVVQHENLILITSQSGEVGNTEENRASAAADASDVARSVLAAVTGNPETTEGPVAQAGQSTIPVAFPLDLALERFQELVRGPAPGETGLRSFRLCGSSGWTVSPRERLAMNLNARQFTDDRELRTYATAEDAVAQMSSIRSAVEGCLEESEGDGGVLTWTLLDEDTGYETVTFSMTHNLEQGDTVVQFVRVGSAILGTSLYGEFGERGQVDPGVVRDRTGLARRIAPSMCVFTAAGC